MTTNWQDTRIWINFKDQCLAIIDQDGKNIRFDGWVETKDLPDFMDEIEKVLREIKK